MQHCDWSSDVCSSDLTRLPGKILKPFYDGKALLETLLDNLHKVSDAKVIVATSVNENNDELEVFLKEKRELVFRGSENDVLDRYIKAAEVNSVDWHCSYLFG